jgi:hypothetical protein
VAQILVNRKLVPHNFDSLRSRFDRPSGRLRRSSSEAPAPPVVGAWVSVLAANPQTQPSGANAPFLPNPIPRAEAQRSKNFRKNLLPLKEQPTIAEDLDAKEPESHLISSTIETPIATLTAYRKSLIHACVTGQRRVEG